MLCLMITTALAVFTHSPAAYEALKSFEILQLPCRSTLQAYIGAFLHEPGASSHCIANQVSQYAILKNEQVKSGKLEPQADASPNL